MKMIKFILIGLFCLVFSFGFTQKRCASGEKYPKNTFSNNIKMTKMIEDYKRIYPTIDRKLIKIPVVVHIIHNNLDGIIGGQNNSNISDLQVQSQIKVLNEDYRRKVGTLGFNNSAVGEDMNIEFYLANRNPKGEPSTGINRIYNSRNTFDVFEDNFKLAELSYWDSSKYLNIWVTSIADDYLGFAEFPTGNFNGLEINEIDERIDGIMIDHTVFGRMTGTTSKGIYAQGRTLTHEIGHWFGLLHTWGDEFCGDDFAADTPPTERGNLSFSCAPKFSNCDGLKTQNMIENFMDFSPDSCMNIFTVEQANRLRAIIEISKRRKKLINNANLSFPKVENLTVRMLENPSSSDVFKFEVLVKTASDIRFEFFDQIGRKIYNYELKSSESSLQEISKALLPSGVVYMRVCSGKETENRKILNE